MLTLAAIDLRLVIAVSVFLAVGALVWFAIDMFSGDEKATAEIRLDHILGFALDHAYRRNVSIFK
jgi:hypothetical protein